MTDNELRVKVAELLGWTECATQSVDLNNGVSVQPMGLERTGDKYKQMLPDYPNDLNACHEMESSLNTTDLVELYCTLLFGYIDQKSKYQGWLTIHATAKQRCLAFVKTMEAK